MNCVQDTCDECEVAVYSTVPETDTCMLSSNSVSQIPIPVIPGTELLFSIMLFAI